MKIISYHRVIWRYWSLRLKAAGLFLLQFAFWPPEITLMVWNSLPDALTAHIPMHINLGLSAVLFAASAVAQFVHQPNLKDMQNAH